MMIEKMATAFKDANLFTAGPNDVISCVSSTILNKSPDVNINNLDQRN